MRISNLRWLLICAIGAVSAVNGLTVRRIQDIQRMSFGSCNNERERNDLWPKIQSFAPQVWIWMGDNIYGDVRRPHLSDAYIPRLFKAGTPEILREKYEKQLAQPDYSRFVNETVIVGTWDDHDYGLNDGDRRYPYRKESQELFLDFIGEPKDSPRRKQEGVYASHVFGTGHRSVRIILLDVRYHRDPYGTKNGDFLGNTQWEWLEAQLKDSTETFNVIVSGIQMLQNDKLAGEAWARFPAQRDRLLDTILRSAATGVVLLSGDVHFAEVAQISCLSGKRKVIEMTSSGMTHSWFQFPARMVRPVMKYLFLLGNWILHWEFRPNKTDYYGDLNYGEMEFVWAERESDPSFLNLRVLDADGRTQLHQSVSSVNNGSLSTLAEHDCLPVRHTSAFTRIGLEAVFCAVVISVATALALFVRALVRLIFPRSSIVKKKERKRE